MGQKSSDKDICIAIVGEAVAENVCEQSPACSVAGNKFQLNFIRSLEKVTSGPLHVFSVRPLVVYPKGNTVVVGSNTWMVGQKTKCQLVFFCNLPIVKQVSVAFSIFFYLTMWLWRMRSKHCVVLVYNVFSPFSLPVLCATKLFGGKAIAIIADTPHDNCKSKGLHGIFERLDFYFQTRCMSYFTGIISLTRQIWLDFAPNLPALIIEGGVDPQEEEYPGPDSQDIECSANSEKIILFSGRLYDINGIVLLLKAFDKILGADYRLWIFGNGPLRSIVKKAAEEDTRITYWGEVSNRKVQYFQKRAMVLINPRPSDLMITRYTFPSKLLEYMLSGRPVISTLLPGIPDEYHPYLYLLPDETPEGVARQLQDICSKDSETLSAFGKRAREFVMQQKNWTLQGHRVYEFIKSCASETSI